MLQNAFFTAYIGVLVLAYAFDDEMEKYSRRNTKAHMLTKAGDVCLMQCANNGITSRRQVQQLNKHHYRCCRWSVTGKAVMSTSKMSTFNNNYINVLTQSNEIYFQYFILGSLKHQMSMFVTEAWFQLTQIFWFSMISQLTPLKQFRQRIAVTSTIV
jgi:hypothetical protein